MMTMSSINYSSCINMSLSSRCPNHVDPNMVIFHPVYTDSRVLFPSHYKHFEVQTFAFAMDQDNLSDQVIN